MSRIPLNVQAEFNALRDMPPDQQLQSLIEFVGSASKSKSQTAMMLLCGVGPMIVSTLIREAFVRRRRPTLAVRLLEVVERIGGPVNLSDWMLLATGGAAASKPFREACARLLMTLGYARPDSTDALARQT